jgi:AAA+ ATPase superfamily predicted ATPase
VLFDVQPKEKKSDLFNYEEEYAALMAAISDKNTPVIAITGLRRTGKTSLMKIAFNSMKTKKAYLDARMLGSTEGSISDNIIAELSRDDLFAKIIGRIGSLELPAVGARLAVSSKGRRLLDVLAGINRQGGTVIFVDEAQLLKPSGFDSTVAYCYDNLRNIKFVLSGSEVGVLDKFLGRENADAPMFGRAVDVIRLSPLPEEKAVRFLLEGMQQAGLAFDSGSAKAVVGRLDGIAGWLAMFGWHASRGNSSEKSIEMVISEGGRLVKKEVEKFLEGRAEARKRYSLILSLCAREPASWTEIKEYLERKERKKIGDKQIAKYIEALVDYGFIVKKNGGYSIPDPVFKHLFV